MSSSSPHSYSVLNQSGGRQTTTTYVCNARLNGLDRPLQQGLSQIVCLLVQILFKGMLKEWWVDETVKMCSNISNRKPPFWQGEWNIFIHLQKNIFLCVFLVHLKSFSLINRDTTFQIRTHFCFIKQFQEKFQSICVRKYSYMTIKETFLLVNNIIDWHYFKDRLEELWLLMANGSTVLLCVQGWGWWGLYPATPVWLRLPPWW